MARPTNASLELSKARRRNGDLELNPAHVVRLLAVLRVVAEGPKMAAGVAVIHPATLASRPVPRMQAGAVLGQQGTLAATSPAPTAHIQARVVIEASMASTLRPVVPTLMAEYDINVFRGPSSAVADDWQRADLLTDAVACDWQQPALVRANRGDDWQEAEPLTAAVVDVGDRMPRGDEVVRACFDEGQPLATRHGQPCDNLPPGHARVAALWVEAAPVARWQLSGYRYPPRFDREWQADRWQQGRPLALATLSDWQPGLPAGKGWLGYWEQGMQPPPGTSPPPVPPITPEQPEQRSKTLVFGRKRGDASLEFVWYPEHTVVIPTRRVYFVINTASITRLSDGLPIPAVSVSIELDADAWAWQFSAQLPRIEDAEAADGEELEILINGHRWRFLAEKWSDSSAFNQRSATISGRSLTACLSSSYVVPASTTEANARTLAQLAEQQLPVGWTLNWQAASWLVPGNTWSIDRQAPISAIAELAEAAGAFVLPAMADKAITVKPRYPTLPWQLASATPDVVIPHAVMVSKGRQRDRGQDVNGVWVSSGGDVLGACLVKRQGSGADRLLPDQLHPLMVDTDGIRAYGSALLAGAGPRTDDDIELPLSDDTGLILPGMLASTPDGKGYVRGLRISASRSEQGALTVRQTITLERPEA